MKRVINTYKTILSFVLLVIIASCSNQSSMEDTIPSIASPKGTFGPIPTDMTISIDYPRGYDRQQFQIDYGLAMGLSLVYSCPSNPDRELWTVDYLSEADFIAKLATLFEHVGPKTQSNGTGGYQSYVKYNSSSGNTTNANNPQQDIWFSPVFIAYDGSCN